jgi:hypothetical protein
MAWHGMLAFSEFLWSLKFLSPDSCALKFTQVHILTFLNFLQFFGIF